MTWVLLALTAAACSAGRDVIIKAAMRPGDEAAVSFLVFGTAAAVLLPLGIALGEIRDGATFSLALLLSGGINAAAALMIARAVHGSDLSLVAPLQSATPIFLIPVAWLVLGELPAPGGAVGILVIVAGAYLLSTAALQPIPATAPAPLHGPGPGPPGHSIARRQSLAAAAARPLKALAADRGARLMLAVAALYAVSGTVDKAGVMASAPLLWSGALCTFVALALLPHVLVGGAVRLRGLAARTPARLVLGGLVMSAGVAAQMMALPMTSVAYVIAVKRTSILFAVLAGGLLFRERGLARRLAGAAVMLAGFVLVSLLG
jgi:uncharacterized membrane protein